MCSRHQTLEAKVYSHFALFVIPALECSRIYYYSMDKNKVFTLLSQLFFFCLLIQPINIFLYLNYIFI